MSMQHTTFKRLSFLSALGLLAIGCGDDTKATASGETMTTGVSVNVTVSDSASTEPTTTVNVTTGPGKLDLPNDGETVDLGCNADGKCNLLDILFVIDNSGTMGEEQKNLAANFPYLIDKIRNLKDKEMNPVNADVNIMVTTTDFGHPLCTPFQRPDYTPAKGAPINDACVDRLGRFTSLDNKVMVPEACTNGCVPGQAAVPMDPFINFNPDSSNVVGGDPNGDLAAQALSCIGPQGIDGCGMEAPLETMLQALNPDATWNMGSRPFLRKGAVLAIVVLTDEADCSVKDYKYFDPQMVNDPMYNQYWENDPMTGNKNEPTSAVCFNAGVSCIDNNADGIYESCMSEDKGVLQPLQRYIGYLKSQLIEKENKQVIMLGILGVPKVTEHNPVPPYQPTAGGVFDLVYRMWNQSDILPGDPKTPQQKEYEFGIGPGCTDAATGQAVPNTRVTDVCQALDIKDDPNTASNEAKIRCCIESICDDDFSDAINCLAGILEQSLIAPG